MDKNKEPIVPNSAKFGCFIILIAIIGLIVFAYSLGLDSPEG